MSTSPDLPLSLPPRKLAQTSKKKTKKSGAAKRPPRPTLPPFDKYVYYSESVQSSAEDMAFSEACYVAARGTAPRILREDFCGTFVNCRSWVERGPDKIAHGVDLDPEPLAWGEKHTLKGLDPDAAQRIHIHKKDVLGPGLPKVDVISALNFSYYIFKTRPLLKKYFENCYKTLLPNGVIVLDLFGGSRCHDANEDEIEFKKPLEYKYYWDQVSFDPLTAHSKFAIHFLRPGEKRRENVFTYDWRMWTAPELKDLLEECGFTVRFYWEGVTDEGEGDGEFKIVEEGEACESWVAYIAALK